MLKNYFCRTGCKNTKNLCKISGTSRFIGKNGCVIVKNYILYSVLLLSLAVGILLATDKSLQQDGVTFNDCLSLIGGKDTVHPQAEADSLHTAAPVMRNDGSMLIFMNAASLIDGHAAAKPNL